MPRGIPNAKRDDFGMRYTTFHVPLLPNPKNSNSNFVKNESQTVWGRNAARQASKPKAPEDLTPGIPEVRRGSKVIVIHPGSKFLKIGKASDVTPIQVPHVIARRHTEPIHPSACTNNVGRLNKGKQRAAMQNPDETDEYTVIVSSDDPMESKIAAISTSLRDRMRFYRLKVNINAAHMCDTFNEQFQPEEVDDDRKRRTSWIMNTPDESVLVGERALLLRDSHDLGYTLKRPIHGSGFNTKDYQSHQALLNDLETIWTQTIQEGLGVDLKTLKDYSVMLVIPDLWDRFYVQELVNVCLVNIGFKQICVQQESLAATYGAGITNACVVDIGAVKTSVACVDDGLVLPDSRLSLSLGGDDITEFLYVLLDRISFPYRDCNLARSCDWAVLEDIKAEICTLSEADVELNLYEFNVRRPGHPTLKFGLRAYDEVILAPMVLFDPRVIEFEQKRICYPPASNINVTDEIMEYLQDKLTGAMLICTQHLMPPTQSSITAPTGNGLSGNGSVTAQDSSLGDGETNGTQTPAYGNTKVDGVVEEAASENFQTTSTDVDIEGEVKPPLNPQPTYLPESKPLNSGQHQGSGNSSNNQPNFLGDLPIDVFFEASKLPLDVAIYNSARATGGQEKIRKYLQSVLVIGGSAAIPGMTHALESRLQAIASPLVENMEKVQVVAPARDTPPHTLAWKGAAVLSRMDSISELWLTKADWEIFGLRGLKERCFYL